VRAAPAEELLFREGRAGDLRSTFDLGERALHHTARWLGVTDDPEPGRGELDRRWEHRRPLLEFMAAQQGSSFWVCEGPEEIVGYARVLQYEGIEELAQIMVEPAYHGQGIGRALLERCWPYAPSPQLGRVVVAAGSTADLSLYTEFGLMPVAGHWHLQQRSEEYLEQRSQETLDGTEPGVHLLEPGRAVREWGKLEPTAIAHERPRLHEFFGRERICLACVDGETGSATSLCWVSPDLGDIGPAVGRAAEDLVPVVLAALDRVAKSSEPEELHVFCTTDSWWLLRRLRALGLRVSWPSWVMCSVPLPGLDRYVPTRPALLL
jgi:N-acetylglutamate synthase-like GNAT family acetyltransferase